MCVPAEQVNDDNTIVRIGAGSQLLDVVQHADVASRLLGRHDGRCRGQHGEAQEHEGADQHLTISTIGSENHDNMLTVELILGGLQQRDEGVARTLRQHAVGQRDEERAPA